MVGDGDGDDILARTNPAKIALRGTTTFWGAQAASL